MMKVHELIEALSRLPPDAPVIARDSEDGLYLIEEARSVAVVFYPSGLICYPVSVYSFKQNETGAVILE
jgi:hypothetical protein